MLSASAGAVTYRGALSLVLSGWAASLVSFIADEISPVIPVTEQQDVYWEVAAGSLLGAPDNNRAPAGAYKRIPLEIVQGTYNTISRGLETPIAKEHRAKYGMLGLEMWKSKQLVLAMKRSRELRIATKYINRTLFPVATATGHDASADWAGASGVPVTDILTGKQALYNNLGVSDTGDIEICAAMSYITARKTMMNPQIRTGLGGQYTNPDFDAAILDKAHLARALGVSAVAIGNQPYKSGGSETSPTVTQIWSDDYCLLFARMKPEAARSAGGADGTPAVGLSGTFSWTEFGGDLAVTRYSEPSTGSDVLQVDSYLDEKTLQTGAGYLIKVRP